MLGFFFQIVDKYRYIKIGLFKKKKKVIIAVFTDAVFILRTIFQSSQAPFIFDHISFFSLVWFSDKDN